MGCLQNLRVFSAMSPQAVAVRDRAQSNKVFGFAAVSRTEPRRFSVVSMKASSGSTSNTEKSDTEKAVKDQKSEIYSHDMTQAMGAVLTYKHDLGMNYNFIHPYLIVGSCLQTPEDVDKLRKIGVKTIFCLQQNPDLEYFGVDIKAIQAYAKTFDDIKHYRAEIRDFDAFDLRMRLPTVVRTLQQAINHNGGGGVAYIHCTAGLGRAPAVAMAYMFWVQGYTLLEAHKLLVSKRPCFPKLEAIKGATADIITGLSKNLVKLTWGGGNGCSSVEVSGLDVGWGQRIPLQYDDRQGAWILERELPEGRYEYKYIVDGNWTFNEYELVTNPNSDGHVNNYIYVNDNSRSMESKLLREHLMADDIALTTEERSIITDYLSSPDH